MGNLFGTLFNWGAQANAWAGHPTYATDPHYYGPGANSTKFNWQPVFIIAGLAAVLIGVASAAAMLSSKRSLKK